VSNTFGSRQPDVVAQMDAATAEWEKFGDIDFIHVAAQDGTCTPTNAAVVFDVRPVNVNGQYLARAFFPNEPRLTRNVLIDQTSFELAPGRKLQLAGILRHELGHTIGARHEHTRPESGACFEDSDWRPLTSYDAFSVMHYPQCNGRGDWSLTLTPKDKSGVACVYRRSSTTSKGVRPRNRSCRSQLSRRRTPSPHRRSPKVPASRMDRSPPEQAR
jgi:hypothetical protein